MQACSSRRTRSTEDGCGRASREVAGAPVSRVSVAAGRRQLQLSQTPVPGSAIEHVGQIVGVRSGAVLTPRVGVRLAAEARGARDVRVAGTVLRAAK